MFALSTKEERICECEKQTRTVPSLDVCADAAIFVWGYFTPFGEVRVDRFQVAATGVSVGASGLLLALGVGLVCDARAREVDARARAHSEQRAARATPGQDRVAQQWAEIQQLRERVARSRTRSVAAQPARVARPDNIDLVIEEMDDETPRSFSTVDARAEMPELAPIRAAVATGDVDKIHEAVAQHNALGGEPVFLHDDPELAKRGITVRSRWDRSRSFGVVLEASATDQTDPCTVLVAPGAIVKSGSDGDQDTAPIQARFIHVGPKEKATASADICCAQIHQHDPRGKQSRGITSHKDPRVARVAAAAERDSASWGAAQVAIWAVANDVTATEVASAPGGYARFIDPARDVLESAGIDTNKLPLYAKANPKVRRDSLDLDILGRIRGG